MQLLSNAFLVCMIKNQFEGSSQLFYVTLYLNIVLGPDYMSRAGPVSRAGVSLPGFWHVYETP